MPNKDTKRAETTIEAASNRKPLVSVIMSVYNCEKTLDEAIESIVGQTYTNWEIIVCDDASTDETLNKLRKAEERIGENRLKILANETNKKLAYSLNRCLKAASGKYIARMDGDDVSKPTRFERQVDFLQANPEIDLVGTSMQRFNSKGEGDLVHPASIQPDKWTMGKVSRVPFNHATIMARRRVFEEVGNYTVSWRTERGQDLDLWFKFFAAGLIGRNIPEALYRVREDEAAVRRRTPKARLGAVVTRIKGSRTLGYPISYYKTPIIELSKILIPYPVYDLHRFLTSRRNQKFS